MATNFTIRLVVNTDSRDGTFTHRVVWLEVWRGVVWIEVLEGVVRLEVWGGVVGMEIWGVLRELEVDGRLEEVEGRGIEFWSRRENDIFLPRRNFK